MSLFSHWLRRFGATLIIIVSLSLVLSPTTGALSSTAMTVAAAQGSDRGEELPDPCEQSLTPPGNANGLHRRCEAIGTGGGAAKGDFNGDGFADLAIGVPHEDRGGVGGVGAVNVIYGSASGLTSTANQFLDEATFGFGYEEGDHFGSALAAGDFNGDGFSDLAIGMPDFNTSTVTNAGTVFVISGSATGLDTSTTRGVGPLTGGRAGAALVWADFNGDGFGDLAVGVPNAFVLFEDLVTCINTGIIVNNAGVVQVFYGSSTGLRSTGAQLFHAGPTGCLFGQNPQNAGLAANENDHFGSTLAAGNFHGGAAADLVIGVPFKDVGGKDAGVVYLLPGGSNKLRGPAAQQLSQDVEGVAGASEPGDQFGRAVATGDFDGDGRDDLAVGVPFEDLSDNANADAGAVQIFFGSRNTELVTTDGSMFISQTNLPGVGVEPGDRMGWALAVGDFDGDGKDDLAIGVPGEDVGAIVDAGLVSVLYGSQSGPSLTRVQNWTQDSASIQDLCEVGDQFGYALSAWNYGNGSQADLVIGVPFEDVVSTSSNTQQVDAGAVNVIYGSPNALTSAGNQFWHQDSVGIRDIAESGDRFGEAIY